MHNASIANASLANASVQNASIGAPHTEVPVITNGAGAGMPVIMTGSSENPVTNPILLQHEEAKESAQEGLVF